MGCSPVTFSCMPQESPLRKPLHIGVKKNNMEFCIGITLNPAVVDFKMKSFTKWVL